MKYHVIVYGCQMNYSDAARIKAVLNNGGWQYVKNVRDADIVIIDTCSVRQTSEDKVRGQIKELGKFQSPPKIWLTGCMIQHNLNLKKMRLASKKQYELGNFVGTVKTRMPLIVGQKPLDEDEQLKTIVKQLALEKNDRRAELLYINHAFDPFFAKMQKTFPHVELFFRIDDVGMLPFIVEFLGYSLYNDIEVSNEYLGIIPHDANFLQKSSKTAFVPISTGCSQFCSYCIVPYARGLEKNRSVEEILKEIQTHLDNGVEEITLLGQIVNKHPQFYEILKTVSEMQGVRWLRYTSPYPTFYDDRIFALHEERENICPHIHIPVQSGSDKILKKMFRGYTVKQFKEFIDKIHSLKRKISITTDMIVGFCDETEDDFQKSMDLVRYAKFDMIYIGVYSPRPGTYGARRYKDNVLREVKKRRHAEMTKLLKQISFRGNQSDVGQECTVLVTHEDQKKGVVRGYNEYMKHVALDARNYFLQKKDIGNFVRTLIIGAKEWSLEGTCIKEAS